MHPLPFKALRHPLAKSISVLLIAANAFPVAAFAQAIDTLPASADSSTPLVTPDVSPTADVPALEQAPLLDQSSLEPSVEEASQSDALPGVITPDPSQPAPDADVPAIDAVDKTASKDNQAQQMAMMGAGSGNIYPTIPAPNVMSLQSARANVDANTGALTFRIPVDIPPGRNGVQPDIALVYNSQNTQDGIAGYGWELSIPYITRFSKTGSNNLYNAGLFTSSLDGELATTSTSTPNLYRGRVDESRRTYSFSSNTWTVYDKNGTRYLFGSASQSQLAPTTSPSTIYRWYLDEIRDTNDNYVSFTYARDGNQLYPDTITYTGHGASAGIFTVVFTKSSRPDPVIDYRPGFKVTTSYRITRITANVNGSMARQYDLGYTSGNNGYRSLLNSIQESGNGDSGTTTLPPMTFSYVSTSTQFVRPDPTVGLRGPGWIPADVNGNGRNDITVFYQVSGSTYGGLIAPDGQSSFGYTPADYWAVTTGYPDNHPAVERGVRFLDINADGKADLVSSYYDGSTTTSAIYLNTTSAGSYAWISTTTGVSSLPIINYGNISGLTSGIFADVNADGLPDFEQRVDGHVAAAAYLASGTGWLSTTTVFVAPKSFPTPFAQTETNSQLVEINGDGLIDWVYSSGGSTYVLLNTGTGWEGSPSGQWTIATSTLFGSGGAYYDRGIRFLDINGDGLPDLVHAYGGSGTAPELASYGQVFLNTGSGWATSTAYTLSTIVSASNSDPIQWQYNEYANWIGNGQMAQDVISTITYPKGGSTSATYSNSTLTGANPELPYELLTVASLTNHDGYGSNEQVSYAYGGGKQYYPPSTPSDRKFAGFAWATTTSPLSTAVEYFHQGDGISGATGEQTDSYAQMNRPYRQDIFSSGGSLLRKTLRKWDAITHGSASFLAVTRELVQDFAGDASHRDRGTEYVYSSSTDDLIEIDEYGEVTGADGGTFTDSGTDGRITTYTYATSTNITVPVRKRVALFSATSSNMVTTDFYTTAGDGSVDYWPGAFHTAHAASTATGLSTTSPVNGSTLWNNGFNWDISRTFLPFDTTCIPADATIQDATLYLRGYKYVNGGSVSLVPSIQASTSTLAYADYGRVTFTQLASDKSTNDFGAYPGSLQPWALNAAGIANVQPAGYTKMAIVPYHDRIDSDPGLAIGNNWGLAGIYTSHAGSDKPYLRVTYSTGTGASQGMTIADTKYYYDGQAYGSVTSGNLTRQEHLTTGSHYASSTASYNSYGLVTTATDRNGATTTYSYDAYNLYPATVTNALSQATQYTYDYATGQVAQTTDPNGRLTKNRYDGLGRVIEKQQSDLTTPASLVTATTFTFTDTSSPPSVVKQSDYLTSTTTVDTYTFTDGLSREVQKRIENNEGSYTTTDKTYDSAGNLHAASLPYFSAGTSYTSPTTTAALLSTYAYDGLGRTTSVVDALGTTATAFSKWTTTTTDKNGHVKDFTKDAFGNLTSVVEHADAANYTTSYGYDVLGNLTSLTDALGNVRAFTYDGLSRRLTATDLHAPADATFGTYSYTYDDAGNLTSHTDPKSQTINRTYDTLGRMLTEDYTGAAGTETTYTYDSCTRGIGLLCTASTTDAKINNAYDILGRVSSATTTINGTAYGSGQTYDLQGNITSQYYPSGARVIYGYGGGGKVESITRTASGSASDIATLVEYGPPGMSHLVFGNGVETWRTYDAAHLYRLSNILTVPPAPEAMMMLGDGAGEESMMLARESAPLAPLQKSAATLKGEAITSQLIPGTIARPRVRIEIVKVEPITDGVQVFARAWQDGRQIGFGKDGTVDVERFRIFNPPLLVADEKGPLTRTFFEIDKKTNKPIEIVGHFREDPKEAILQVLEHDISVMQIHGPGAIMAGKVGRTTDTFFAGSGNGAVEHEINGGYTQVNWDSLHDASTGTGAEYAQTSSNNYYSPGRWANSTWVTLNRAFYPINTSALGADQIVTNATWSVYVTDHYSASVPGGAPMAWSLVQGSQASNSSLSTADYDAWSTTRLASDIANSSITDSAYNTWTLNADGRAAISTTGTTKLAMLASHDLDDYFTTSQNWVTRLLVRYADYAGTSYDPKLVVEHVTAAATTTYQDISYGYDAVGNITALTEYADTDARHTAAYGYDALDRLVSATTTAASTTPFRLTVSYDALGSITGTRLNGGATTTYTYAQTGHANPHAVTSYGGTTYGYDNNGNLTSAGANTFTFDYRNRLTQSVVSGTTTSYGYDHAGSRVFQRVASTTVTYPSRYYSIASFAQSTTTTVSTSTDYIYLGDMLIATVDQPLVNGSATSTPTVSYSHADHLGSTAVMTDGSGNVVQTLDYYPYGGSRISSGTTLNKRQYIGQFKDDSGLSYLNARYYDASRGQFTSEDPVFWEIGQTNDGKSVLGNPQALHSYGYGNGNPIVNKDPSGRCVGPLIVACYAIIGAGISSASTYADDVLDNRNNGRSSPYTTNLSSPSAYVIGDLTGAASLGLLRKYAALSAGVAAGSSLLQDQANGRPLDLTAAALDAATTYAAGNTFDGLLGKVAARKAIAPVTGEIFGSASTLAFRNSLATYVPPSIYSLSMTNRQQAVQSYNSGRSSPQAQLWVTPSGAVINWSGLVVAGPTKQ